MPKTRPKRRKGETTSHYTSHLHMVPGARISLTTTATGLSRNVHHTNIIGPMVIKCSANDNVIIANKISWCCVRCGVQNKNTASIDDHLRHHHGTLTVSHSKMTEACSLNAKSSCETSYEAQHTFLSKSPKYVTRSGRTVHPLTKFSVVNTMLDTVKSVLKSDNEELPEHLQNSLTDDSVEHLQENKKVFIFHDHRYTAHTYPPREERGNETIGSSCDDNGEHFSQQTVLTQESHTEDISLLGTIRRYMQLREGISKEVGNVCEDSQEMSQENISANTSAKQAISEIMSPVHVGKLFSNGTYLQNISPKTDCSSDCNINPAEPNRFNESFITTVSDRDIAQADDITGNSSGISEVESVKDNQKNAHNLISLGITVDEATKHPDMPVEMSDCRSRNKPAVEQKAIKQQTGVLAAGNATIYFDTRSIPSIRSVEGQRNYVSLLTSLSNKDVNKETGKPLALAENLASNHSIITDTLNISPSLLSNGFEQLIDNVLDLPVSLPPEPLNTSCIATVNNHNNCKNAVGDSMEINVVINESVLTPMVNSETLNTVDSNTKAMHSLATEAANTMAIDTEAVNAMDSTMAVNMMGTKNMTTNIAKSSQSSSSGIIFASTSSEAHMYPSPIVYIASSSKPSIIHKTLERIAPHEKNDILTAYLKVIQTGKTVDILDVFGNSTSAIKHSMLESDKEVCVNNGEQVNAACSVVVESLMTSDKHDQHQIYACISNSSSEDTLLGPDALPAGSERCQVANSPNAGACSVASTLSGTHNDIIEAKPACGVCQEEFATAKDLAAHEVEVSQFDIVQCKKCLQKFHGAHRLNVHIFELHESNSTAFCFTCGEVCSSCQELNIHILRHRKLANLHTGDSMTDPNLIITKGKWYYCRLCKKRISNRPNAIKKHNFRKHVAGRQFRCPYCELTFARDCQLERHKEQHASVRLECPLCGKLCYSKGGLSRHMRFHLQEEGGSSQRSGNQLLCPECGKLFIGHNNLQRHLNKHRMDLCRQTKPKAKYTCEMCGQQYVAKPSYERHIAVVHKGIVDFKYKCIPCNKQFYRSIQLRDHNATHHLGVKPYACTYCGKRFACGPTRQRHIRQEHTKEKPYKCPHCNEQFTERNPLVYHVAKHSKIKPYTCSQCDKSFYLKHGLTKHMKLHGPHMYVCHTCGRTFARHDHMKLHTKSCL